MIALIGMGRLPKGIILRQFRLEKSEIMGIRCIRAELLPGARGEKWAARMASRLRSLGASRGFFATDFPYVTEVLSSGVAKGDALPLARALAPRLALSRLEERGVEASQATVGIAAHRLTSQVESSVASLIRRVKSFCFALPRGEAELCDRLLRSYGMPACYTDADRLPEICGMVLDFDRLCLGANVISLQPEALPRLEVAGLTLPPEFDACEILSLLHEQGKIPLDIITFH